MKILLKIERYLFYTLIFLVPLQIRKILVVWDASFHHIFNEWSAAFVYGTDFLIILLLFLWGTRSSFKFKAFSWRKLSKADWFLLVFGVISAMSLWPADNRELGVFRLIKLGEMVALYYYISSSAGRIFQYSQSFTIIMFSGLWQAGLAIGQAIKQASLGLRWMGESVLRTNFQGVAVVPTAEGKFLRAYGSTPHPNILAAWLFLAIFSFYSWYLYPAKSDEVGTAKPLFNGVNLQKDRSWWALAVIYVPLLWGFFFTFSRVAIGLWMAGVVACAGLILLRRKHYHLNPVFLKRIRNLILVSLGTVLVFSYFYWPQVQSRIHISGEEQAVTQRIAYNKIAGAVTENNPWLGIGVGQFVWKMFDNFPDHPAYFYQPVHNIYLLVSSETGLWGVAAFLAFIFCLIYRYLLVTKLAEVWPLSFLVVFLSILVMGLFDHFLWTIQQGEIIFWLVLAFASSRFLADRKVI